MKLAFNNHWDCLRSINCPHFVAVGYDCGYFFPGWGVPAWRYFEVTILNFGFQVQWKAKSKPAAVESSIKV